MSRQQPPTLDDPAMMIRVNGPDGRVFAYRPGTSHDEINAHLDSIYPMPAMKRANTVGGPAPVVPPAQQMRRANTVGAPQRLIPSAPPGMEPIPPSTVTGGGAGAMIGGLGSGADFREETPGTITGLAGQAVHGAGGLISDFLNSPVGKHLFSEGAGELQPDPNAPKESQIRTPTFGESLQGIGMGSEPGRRARSILETVLPVAQEAFSPANIAPGGGALHAAAGSLGRLATAAEEAAPIIGEAAIPAVGKALRSELRAARLANDAAQATESDALLRSFHQMKKYMRPEVVDVVNKGMMKRIASVFQGLPPADEWENAARAGVAKKGWYKNSGQAIKETFGGDTPVFTAILAALSPRQQVESNLEMAVNVFAEWKAAGSPETKAGMMKVLRKVPGASMKSRVPNAMRAMRGQPLVDFVEPGAGGQGWKVESFRRNLLGEMDYSTNDTWVAKFIGKGKDFFSNKSNYLATDAMVRKVANKMGWSTAETQETLWSWIKTLIEQTPSSSTLEEGLKGITHELIAKDPDFSTLFHDKPEFFQQLERYGYKAGRPTRAVADQGGGAAAEALGGGEAEADPRVLERITRRLKRSGVKPVGKVPKPPKVPRAAAPSPLPPAGPPQ